MSSEGSSTEDGIDQQPGEPEQATSHASPPSVSAKAGRASTSGRVDAGVGGADTLARLAEPRVARRLRDSLLIWLVTVAPDGRPQAAPVWFLWDGASFVVYSKSGTARERNLAANPHVNLHLDGDGIGADVLTVEGDAEIAADLPPADRLEPFVTKYRWMMERHGWSASEFATRYPIRLRIRPRYVRAW